MAVSIRLRRMGRKKQPHYRIVVAESEFARDGRFVESIGFYKPLTRPARLVLDLSRVDHWIGQGAQPSDTVRSLISKARLGGDESVALGEVDVKAEKQKRSEMLADRRAKEKSKAAEKAAPKAQAAEAAESPAADAGEETEAPAKPKRKPKASAEGGEEA